MRKSAVFLVLALLCLCVVGAKKATPPVTHAPAALPHQIALFLATLSDDGARTVTFKAVARDKFFFLEEPSGVTVYRWENGGYVKAEFLRASTLAKAIKRHKGAFAGTK